jgi:O-antigen/teichoic acid export membrane protein
MSGANFVVSLLVARFLPPNEFGVYAFVNVLLALGFSISNALFGSILAVKLNEREANLQLLEQVFFKTNLLFSGGMTLLVSIVVWFLDGSYLSTSCYAAFTLLSLLRWFVRSHGLALQNVARVAISDACYGVLVVIGCGVIFAAKSFSIPAVIILLAVSNAASLALSGQFYLRNVIRGSVREAIREFKVIWRLYARWSILGVITTDAASNAHAYIVTALMGPGAFAPLALAGLLWRPTGLTMTSITHLERPVLAASAVTQQVKKVLETLRHFRLLLVFIMVGNLLSIIVLYFIISLPHTYDKDEVIAATALMMIICAVRAIRSPESTLLQATGAFKSMAIIDSVAAAVSLVAVLCMVKYMGAIGSLIGVIGGEAVATILVLKLVVNWKRKNLISASPVS